MINKPEFLVAALNRGLVFPTQSVPRRSDKGLLSCAAAAELFHAGYNVHPDILELMTKDQLSELVAAARAASHMDRNWVPMYPNFPRSVRESDELTLFIDQLVHYLSAGALVPTEKAEDRGALPFADTVISNKTVQAYQASDVPAIVSQIVRAGTAMSDSDAVFVERAAEISPSVRQALMDAVLRTRHEENMYRGLVIARRTTQDPEHFLSCTREVLNSRTNSTGLLRAMLALYSTASTGKEEDYNTAVLTLQDSKAYAVRFHSVPASVRRDLVRRLGAVTRGKYGCDLLRARQDLWRKLCKSIHSFSYVESKDSQRALDVIHSNGTYTTLNAAVENYINEGNIAHAAQELTTYRPAAFLRQLSRLALNASSPDVVKLCEAIESIAMQKRVPVSTFISAYQGIVNYNQDFKVLRIAGALNHAAANTQSLPQLTVDRLSNALLKGVSQRLSHAQLPQSIGTVADNAPVELMRRDASVTDREMIRGQRISIDDMGAGTTVRLFTQWYGSGVDLDLSVGLLDENYSMQDMCSWNTSKRTTAMTHSGDLVSGGYDGATEYVDLNVAKAQGSGARYAVVTVDSFNGDPLEKVDVVAGAAVRSEAQSGELFDPRTVKLSFELTTPATDSLPFIIDLHTCELIWMDSSFGRSSSSGSMRDNYDGITQMVHSAMTAKSVTYGDIVDMLVKDHGVTLDPHATASRATVHAILAQVGL